MGRRREPLPRIYRAYRFAPFAMDVSVVIPLFNERDNLGPLHDELARILGGLGRTYEMLFVDDGSTDGSIEMLRKIKAADAHVRVIRLARNSGQTAALACGLKNAAGAIESPIDGDGEDEPAERPRLLEKNPASYALASGWCTPPWQKALS